MGLLDLRTDAVEEVPVNYDWYNKEFGADWEDVTIPVNEMGVEEIRDWCDRHGWDWLEIEAGLRSNPEEALDEYRDEVFEALGCESHYEPMMNYYYRLPAFDRVYHSSVECAQLALDDLPLCIVNVYDENTPVMALTGGGMDLTWEILEAYTRLGYLPPVHFGAPPRFSGWLDNPAAEFVLRAVDRAAAVMESRAKHIGDSARAMLEDLENREGR